MSESRQMLTRLELTGFKTIRRLENLDMGPINVLIGPNGAGKSNLISFFKMLGWMMPPPGNLQFHVARSGGANSLLHSGASVTPQITAELTFQKPQGVNQYRFRLFHAAQDTLVFAEERFRFARTGLAIDQAKWTDLGAGHREAKIIERAQLKMGGTTARTIWSMLRHCVVYQFHNTSETARIRQRWGIDDNRFLKEDGANLAPFLLRLREVYPAYYRRITETLRQVAPYFGDFVLEPEDNTLLLRWQERGSDLIFGPHQASDGTLRAMALITLLLQPADELPALIVLDEPELGLHPRAISILAGLLLGASRHSQVLVATQSPVLLDHFDPEQVIVVERDNAESIFRHLDSEKLGAWLEEYTLAELWDKNVFGGRPR